ncbi:hypothetical protein IEQ34_004978 [Dendrobium chrysotoxum]|uniref:Uncharacterized protein n=1 Tax=Dendrobium chrysotoxum TaxID=161865 RepID=A0AAV7H9V9_DENCH|nr:hypothetical protein IEQ34_004978 [Dendrobium chrysotoxum]
MDEETNNTANTKSEGESSVRRNWPELLGLTGEEAKKRIKEENPALRLHVVGPDRMVTADFRSDRVWIWVDSEGKVSHIIVIVIKDSLIELYSNISKVKHRRFTAETLPAAIFRRDQGLFVQTHPQPNPKLV